jgi:flagellar motor switch protein FliN/FliY
MSDILSQDQVDALLAGGLGGGLDSLDGGEEQTVSAGLDYRALGMSLETFGQKTRNVLSTVLNRAIGFAMETCQALDTGVAAPKLPGDLLALSIPLSGGVQGDMHVVITKKDVAALSDLMMLGDGSAAYVDDHKDAIAELLNQIMGAYASALSSQVGSSVSVGQIEVKEFGFGQPTIDMNDLEMAIFRLRIDGVSDSSVAVFVQRPLGVSLAKSHPASSARGSDSGASDDGVGLSDAELNDLAGVTDNSGGNESIGAFRETPLAPRSTAPKENVDMLLDVELDVAIELGKTNLSIKRILELAPGSIVELDRMAGEPVDLVVNGKVVAKGEVVVVDENFGIRIVSLVSAQDRIRSLR